MRMHGENKKTMLSTLLILIAMFSPTTIAHERVNQTQDDARRGRVGAFDPRCVNRPAYRSPQGLRCESYFWLDCYSFSHVGFSEDDVQELLESCPKSCNAKECESETTPIPLPQVEDTLERFSPEAIRRQLQSDGCENVDNPFFVGRQGGSCESFVGLDCLEFTAVGYLPLEVYNLATNCPATCDVPCGSITLSPSSSPSVSPTISMEPSSAPTSSPSVSPSSHPSSLPSFEPSAVPSTTPSNQPSLSPSTSPSFGPSTSPSSSPSSQPSALPSSEPSSIPSASPSSDPSASPSVMPSSSPSMTPSASPSSSPSQQPSSKPSISPSSTPSSLPSTTPSVSPSSLPSNVPSSAPSTSPSLQPSSFPSAQPSVAPSSQPTALPSDEPSHLPSYVPSKDPSSSPSSTPSSSPTTMPSKDPSSSPSMMPSNDPSSSPSMMPSNDPSLSPSSTPSSSPSTNPSASPSTPPSNEPSSTSSKDPSTSPSALPEPLLISSATKGTSNDASTKSANATALIISICVIVPALALAAFLIIRRFRRVDESVNEDSISNDEDESQQNVPDHASSIQGVSTDYQEYNHETNSLGSIDHRSSGGASMDFRDTTQYEADGSLDVDRNLKDNVSF